VKKSWRLYGAAVVLLLLLAAAMLLPCIGLDNRRAILAVQSAGQIRAELLEKTPLGSDIATVDRLIIERVFKDRHSYELRHPSEPLLFWRGPASGYVSATIGTYCLIWRTDVVAYWVLDENRRVTEVVVEKHFDAP